MVGNNRSTVFDEIVVCQGSKTLAHTFMVSANFIAVPCPKERLHDKLSTPTPTPVHPHALPGVILLTHRYKRSRPARVGDSQPGRQTHMSSLSLALCCQQVRSEPLTKWVVDSYNKLAVYESQDKLNGNLRRGKISQREPKSLVGRKRQNPQQKRTRFGE